MAAVVEGAALAVVAEADQRGIVASSTAAGLGQWVRVLADEVDAPLTSAEVGQVGVPGR